MSEYLRPSSLCLPSTRTQVCIITLNAFMDVLGLKLGSYVIDGKNFMDGAISPVIVFFTLFFSNLFLFKAHLVLRVFKMTFYYSLRILCFWVLRPSVIKNIQR